MHKFPADFNESDIEKILANILDNDIDYADLYFQYSMHESWFLEDGIIKEGAYDINNGVGIRALSGEKTGFAYADDIILPAIKQAADAAKTIAKKGGGTNSIKAWHKPTQKHMLYQPIDPLKSIPDLDKIDLLRKIDKEARIQDPRVTKVIASLSGVYDIILIAASDGTFVEDMRPLVRLDVTVTAEANGKHEQASHGGGGRSTYKIFLENNFWQDLTRKAVHQAIVNLDARPAPAGVMPVVLSPGWPGILLHEAIGHGLEGDFNRKKSSSFADLLGCKVASDLCTIVDDGTLSSKRGSLNVDDEGTLTACTTLIEKGILKGYMQDKLNAKLMKMPLTGNARRQSYAYLPIPRMTNTYMLPGSHTHEEIISSVKKGIYATYFGGGQVDITSGKFVFNANEAYLIENGKITVPIKGATLIGHGPHILKRVSMVGNNLELDRGIGLCGKEGQSVPIGVGQPTLLIDGITVGGTQS